MDERKKLTVSGVGEVVSFEENAVVLRTSRGTLLVRGQDLHLKTLSLDGGQVAVDGTVTALIYEEPRREGGFFSRLFGCSPSSPWRTWGWPCAMAACSSFSCWGWLLGLAHMERLFLHGSGGSSAASGRP